MLSEQLARRAGTGDFTAALFAPFSLGIVASSQSFPGTDKFLAVFFQKTFLAKTLNQKLDPRLGALGAVGILVMQGHQCFQRKQQLVFWNEFFNHDGLMWFVSQAAARFNHEAVLPVFLHCHHAGIMQQRLRTIGLATGKAHLEFAR